MAVRYDLPRWHLQALEWFETNAGREFSERPFDVGLPIKVSSLQKGIWKPAGTQYAVSVVQTRKGVYDDQDPSSRPMAVGSTSTFNRARALKICGIHKPSSPMLRSSDVPPTACQWESLSPPTPGAAIEYWAWPA